MYKNLYNIALAFVGVLALAMGFWGFHECAEICNTITLQQQLVATLSLLRGASYSSANVPTQLVIAQYAIPAVAVLAGVKLFFVGLRRDLRVALARRKRNHTIVCGLSNAGMQIVQSLREAGQDVVAIDRNSTAPHAITCEGQGVPVLAGDGKNPGVLRVAGIRRARTIVICTGVDAENMDIALRIKKLVAEHPRFLRRRLGVLVELRSDWLFTKLVNLGATPLGSADVEMRLFSTYANAARMLIEALRLPPTPDIAADTFVVLGFGILGREVTQQIVRAAPAALGRKINIIVFDQHAEEARQKFLEACPAAGEFADVQFVGADLKTETSDLKKVAAEKLRSAALLGVAICLHDDATSLFMALEMRALLDQLRHLHVPVYVRLEHQRRLGDFAGDLEGVARFRDRLRPFGALEDLFSPSVFIDGKLDALAQAFHDDYRSGAPGTLNPEADRPWHDLPEFMKMSNRWRADHTPIMLALASLRVQHVASPAELELSAEEIDTLAQLEHRRWRIERRLLGWEYGPVLDHAKRHHPDLVEWDKISEGSRKYNREAIGKLAKILAKVGIEIRREHKIRAYGATLPTAMAEIKKAATDTHGVHHVVIADIDQLAGRLAAEHALTLAPLSLWLLSRGAPKELFQRRPRAADEGLTEALRQAEGWVGTEQVEFGRQPPA